MLARAGDRRRSSRAGRHDHGRPSRPPSDSVARSASARGGARLRVLRGRRRAPRWRSPRSSRSRSLPAALWTARSPLALAVTGGAALVAGAAALAWGLRPLRHAPSDARARALHRGARAVARRSARRAPWTSSRRRIDALAPLARTMLADAARAGRTRSTSTTIVPRRRAAPRGVPGARPPLLVLAAVACVGRDRAREAWDAASLALFPSRVTLRGDAGQRAGEGRRRRSRSRRELVGNRAPVGAQVRDRVRSAMAGRADAPRRRRPLPPRARRRSARRSSTAWSPVR